MTRRQRVLRPSSKAWAGRFPACLAFTASIILLAFSPAQAGGNNRQTLQYEVYAGGIHAVQAELDVDLTKAGRYAVILSAKTRGFLASLAPWVGSFESSGWILDKNDYRPEIHKSVATWRDEREVKEYSYGKDRSFKSLTITDHEKPTRKEEVEDELTQGTTDVLTATLIAMRAVSENQKCEGTSEVFDGKRRYQLQFVHKGEEQMTPSKYNIYGGAATICTAEVVPVAGKWYEKPRGWMSIQEQGRAKGTIPTVWMAQINKNGPAVPIKVMVKTDYGALVMHLAEYKSGDMLMVAENRVTEEDAEE